MTYVIKTGEFSGPLDLLLQLIETEKLEVSRISLAQVAEQYLARVKGMRERDPDEISDFLLVAARLLLLKSIYLLPFLASQPEEESVAEFEQQIRVYQRFVAVAKTVDEWWRREIVLFNRERVPEGLMQGFQPPAHLTARRLAVAMREVVTRLRPVATLASERLARRVSIEEKIRDIEKHLEAKTKFAFSHVIGDAKSRELIIVSFLALLELLKQRRVIVSQEQLFSDMVIQGSI